MFRTGTLLASVALVGAGAGCASSDNQRGSPGALDGSDAPIDPPLETIYTIGALDGDDWETFGSLGGIGFDEDGNLYVFDRDASRVTIIGLDGAHVRTFGKSGGGPGELLQPFAFTVLRDGRSAVFDIGHRALQLYDSRGGFDRSVTLDPEEGLPGPDLVPLGSDAIVSWGGIRMRTSAGSQSITMGEEDVTRPVERFSLIGGGKEVAYEAWRPPPPEGDASEMEFSEGNSRMQLQMAPMEAFQPNLYVRALSDGRLVIADSIGYRVKLIGPSGELHTIERSIAPIVATQEIRDRERELRLAAAADQGGGRMMVFGGGGGMQIDQDAMRKMMEDQIAQMRFGPVIPVIVGLGVDWSDRIWVERSGEPGEEGPIDILGADGYYYGTILPGGTRIPDAFGPDGLLAYIDTDEIGVERVRVVRLVDGESLEGAAGG